MLKTIGYLSGVYDLIHHGHINYFQEAKKHCDYLIVAVNSDSLVYNYKKRYPINSADKRIFVLNSIKYIDEVVLRNDLDKLIEYDKYKFDILFVSDSKKEDLEAKKVIEILKDKKVKVIEIPYTNEISSSILSKEVKEGNIC